MSHNPVRILIVDDIVENLDALEALLEHEDLEVARAASGIEALELLLVEDYALALLDVQMPGMDGFELAELMRGTERTRRIPIIFLTAVATDEVKRFRGYETGAVDYLFKPINSQVLKSKIEIFVELHRQRLELARQRDELAAALSRVRAHRDNSPLAIVEFDQSLKVLDWSMGAERMFGRTDTEMVGAQASDSGWMDEAAASAIKRLIGEMLAGGKERDVLELTLFGGQDANATKVEAECYCSALRDNFARLVSINMQIQDVTERKRAEATQHLLIGELNHRVKNTLASVQAIASQTLRHSSGPSEFAPTFIGRIHALSTAHSLLSEATWRGASLRELVRGQIDIGMTGPDRFAAYGPDLELAPEPALHLALVIHELVTNAVKYGALSNATGRVDLNWSVVGDMIRFEWVESGGPTVTKPRRIGFGSRLIERSLKGEGGAAEAKYARDGIRWLISLPTSKIVRKKDARRNAASEPSAPLNPAQAPTDSLAGLTALVIEDEPLVALNIADLLEQAGVKVIGQPATRQDALQALEDATPDLVLLDGNLQGESVELIAERLFSRHIPFVVVSGYGRGHLPEALGAVPVVLKPFSNAELLDALHQLMLARKQA